MKYKNAKGLLRMARAAYTLRKRNRKKLKKRKQKFKKKEPKIKKKAKEKKVKRTIIQY